MRANFSNRDQLISPKPVAASAPPRRPPKREWDELGGIPTHEAMGVQTIIPHRLEKRINDEAGCMTGRKRTGSMNSKIEQATALPRRRAPVSSAKEATRRAFPGVTERERMLVATTLLPS